MITSGDTAACAHQISYAKGRMKGELLLFRPLSVGIGYGGIAPIADIKPHALCAAP